jgi:hypothetical protein
MVVRGPPCRASNPASYGYDGSFWNRKRLPLEIANDLLGIWPKDKPHGAAFSKKALMVSVDADGKLLDQATRNLFDGTGTDFRPTPDDQGAILRAEFIRTAASARIDTDEV